MPIPDLKTLCPKLTASPQGLTITMVGGAELSAQVPDSGLPDALQMSKQLLAQANAALAPLVPLFNVIDVCLALFKAVKAVPDAISSLSPGKITEAIPDLTKKASKLLKLVPQLSVPLMIVGLVDAILLFLEGIVGQLKALVAAQAQIAASEARAAELGNAQLQATLDCAKETIAVQLQSLSAGAEPVNRLIGLINLFCELAGLPKLPDIADLGSDAQVALDRIDGLRGQLQQVRAAIPV